MKRILAFCLLLFPALMKADADTVHPKLDGFLEHLLQTDKETTNFSIIARVSDIESWKKSSVTHFGCKIGPLKDDESWIVTAYVTKEQLANILNQSFVISASGARTVYPCNTTDI